MYLLTLALLCQLPPAMPPLPPDSLRVASATTPSHAESDPREELAPAVEIDGPAGVRQPPDTAQQVLTYAQRQQFVSLPRHQLRSPQCAGGACGVQPAAEPRRFSFQAQPVRRFLFRRR